MRNRIVKWVTILCEILTDVKLILRYHRHGYCKFDEFENAKDEAFYQLKEGWQNDSESN